jgi:hypothetical protein
MRKPLLMTGLFVLVLMTVASFHVCLHSIDHSDANDSKHHCLLCTVFGQTILGSTLSDFLPATLKANSPFPLNRLTTEESPELALIAVRAPPRSN